MDASNYDHQHRARNLPDLAPGDLVWITDRKTKGTVTSTHGTPGSYLVSGPRGTVRRNRRHLVPVTTDNSSHTRTCCWGRPGGHSSGHCYSATREASGHSTTYHNQVWQTDHKARSTGSVRAKHSKRKEKMYWNDMSLKCYRVVFRRTVSKN